MKNTYIIFILFLNTVIAQVSMSDINKISNNQLDAIKAELQSNTQVTEEESIDAENPNMASPIIIPSTEILRTEIPPTKIPTDETDYFGYDYFRKDISFFDNIATPL